MVHMEHSCASQLRTGGNQEIWKECDPISSKVKLVLGPGAPVYLARERLPDHRVVVRLSHPLARALPTWNRRGFQMERRYEEVRVG